jgi:hypothetical protein
MLASRISAYSILLYSSSVVHFVIPEMLHLSQSFKQCELYEAVPSWSKILIILPCTRGRVRLQNGNNLSHLRRSLQNIKRSRKQRNRGRWSQEIVHKHRTQTQDDHTNLNTYKARNSTKTEAQGRRRKARILVSGREREDIHGGCLYSPRNACQITSLFCTSKDCEKKQQNQSDEDDKDEDGSIDSLQQSSTKQDRAAKSVRRRRRWRRRRRQF